MTVKQHILVVEDEQHLAIGIKYNLEAEGYLERRGDPDDGRAKRVHMTARGYEIQIVGLGLMSEFERGLADALGDQKLARFRQGAEAARHWLQVCLEAER